MRTSTWLRTHQQPARRKVKVLHLAAGNLFNGETLLITLAGRRVFFLVPDLDVHFDMCYDGRSARSCGGPAFWRFGLPNQGAVLCPLTGKTKVGAEYSCRQAAAKV